MSLAKSCSFCPYPATLQISSRPGEGGVREKGDEPSLQGFGDLALLPDPRPALAGDPQADWASESKANLHLASQVGRPHRLWGAMSAARQGAGPTAALLNPGLPRCCRTRQNVFLTGPGSQQRWAALQSGCGYLTSHDLSRVDRTVPV